VKGLAKFGGGGRRNSVTWHGCLARTGRIGGKVDSTLPVLAFTVLPFAALHRAVSASAIFGNIILLLIIYWKFHVADGQNRSLFFRVKRMPTSFLWISQTPNLIAAYHRGGRFNDVQILDVRKDIGGGGSE